MLLSLYARRRRLCGRSVGSDIGGTDIALQRRPQYGPLTPSPPALHRTPDPFFDEYAINPAECAVIPAITECATGYYNDGNTNQLENGVYWYTPEQCATACLESDPAYEYCT